MFAQLRFLTNLRPCLESLLWVNTADFIDFKKAFDRVWRAALRATMKKYIISANLIRVIKNLYDKATSAA